jgi:zinc transporter 9
MSPSVPQRSKTTPLNATTTGLIIHAFADGIALGASTAHPSSVGLVVFIAIMIHKAPAAFGLTTQLLKQGLNKREARGHLLLFSLAAPLGAFVTWFAVRILGGGSDAGGDGKFEAGMALVFSGGTFLYVAVHSLQSHSHGSNEAESSTPMQSDIMYTALGMLLPLVTQIGHSHAHG